MHLQDSPHRPMLLYETLHAPHHLCFRATCPLQGPLAPLAHLPIRSSSTQLRGPCEREKNAAKSRLSCRTSHSAYRGAGSSLGEGLAADRGRLELHGPGSTRAQV